MHLTLLKNDDDIYYGGLRYNISKKSNQDTDSMYKKIMKKLQNHVKTDINCSCTYQEFISFTIEENITEEGGIS